jgi:hypothetical protein
MFVNFNIRRRSLAVIGVALTMLSVLQQSHALCQLGACGAATSVDDSSVCTCKQCKSQPDRGSGNCCSSTRTPSRDLPEERAGSQDSAWPTSGNCICCEGVQAPIEAPRVQVDALSALLSCAIDSSFVAAQSHTAANTFGASGEFAQRSLETCVRLCRFLA